MNLTAAYVVLRAAVERAQHPTDAGARVRRAAPEPPTRAALIADAPRWGKARHWRLFCAEATVAAVRRAPSGRLAPPRRRAHPPVGAPALLPLLARRTAGTPSRWHRSSPWPVTASRSRTTCPSSTSNHLAAAPRARRRFLGGRLRRREIQGALFAWTYGAAGIPGAASPC